MDTVVGKVQYVIDKKTIRIRVTHVGRSNKFDYNSSEMIVINKNAIAKPVDKLPGKIVRCFVNYRDEYSRLHADIEDV
jgi:hypothetical protein